MNPSRLVALLLLPSLLLSARARAAEDLLTPRAVGMGDSLRADATGAMGPLVNPAMMAMRRAYTIEANYGFRFQDTGSNLLASIVDSVTSRVAAGVYYSYVHASRRLSITGLGDVDMKRQGSEAGLALALPLGQMFGFGLTAKYVRIASTVDPADNPNVPALTGPLTLDSTISAASADGFTLDVGTALRLGDSLMVAVVGQNLVPLRSIEAPITLGTGLAYRLGAAFTVSADFDVYFNKYQGAMMNNLTTYKVGGGLEWLIAGKVALRGGSYWDSGRPGTYVSGGAAYVGQSFAIDVGYKQQVQSGSESLLCAGVRVFLE